MTTCANLNHCLTCSSCSIIGNYCYYGHKEHHPFCVSGMVPCLQDSTGFLAIEEENTNMHMIIIQGRK